MRLAVGGSCHGELADVHRQQVVRRCSARRCTWIRSGSKTAHVNGPARLEWRSMLGVDGAAFVFVRPASPQRIAKHRPAQSNACELHRTSISSERVARRAECAQDSSTCPSAWRIRSWSATEAPASTASRLRPMTAADLAAAHALSTELRWPHRPADWEQAFRHGEGLSPSATASVVGTGLRWRWGERHATHRPRDRRRPPARADASATA